MNFLLFLALDRMQIISTNAQNAKNPFITSASVIQTFFSPALVVLQLNKLVDSVRLTERFLTVQEKFEVKFLGKNKCVSSNAKKVISKAMLTTS